MTITFKQWVKESSNVIDTTWTHEDRVELYFERMDAEMFL